MPFIGNHSVDPETVIQVNKVLHLIYIYENIHIDMFIGNLYSHHLAKKLRITMKIISKVKGLDALYT